MYYLGYTITRGAYQGTCDDRLDRWYAYPADGDIDRRGEGFATRRAAKQAVENIVSELDD